MSKGGRAVDVALISASVDAARGNCAAPCATLRRLLEQAAPGQVGWMIPIDPSLLALRNHADFQRLGSLLSSRGELTASQPNMAATEGQPQWDL
jgi:hypothetical protein